MITSLTLENFLGFLTPTVVPLPPGPLPPQDLASVRTALELLAAVPGDLEAAVKAGVGAAQTPFGWASPGSRKAVVSLEAQVDGDGGQWTYGLRFSLVNGSFSVTDELIVDRACGRHLYWYENGTRRQLLWTPEGLRELPHQQQENRRSVLSWRDVWALNPALGALAAGLSSASR